MIRSLTACALLLAASSLAAQQERYVAFGDSITFGIGDELDKGGYPGRLQSLLTNAGKQAVVENEGVSGETTAEGLSRISSIPGAAGDTLILMEGTNDIYQSISLETTLGNLRQMVNRGGQLGYGKVLLANVLPISPRATNRSARSRARQMAEEIRQLAWEMRVGQPEAHWVIENTPNIFTNLYADAVHPNAAGYDILAKVFADYILARDTVPPVETFVSPPSGSENVSPDVLLEVVLFDRLSGVDSSRARLLLDDGEIPTEVSGDPERTVLRSRPGSLTGRRLLSVSARDRASPPNELDQDVSLFTIAGTTFHPADINRSGRVDGGDLLLLALAFGTFDGNPRYSPAADINNDGRVDGGDLAILAAAWGQSTF
jgi:acyl-CoA thioesterase I